MVNKQQSSLNNLKEENEELKHELKIIKKNKKQNTQNVLMGIYIILAIVALIKTESGYVFGGSIILGVAIYLLLDHILEIDKG